MWKANNAKIIKEMYIDDLKLIWKLSLINTIKSTFSKCFF
jgi:hypothetical protein